MCYWCNVNSVIVLNCDSNERLFELALPRTRCLQFSPKGSYLSTWEPYIGTTVVAVHCLCSVCVCSVTKDIPAGQSNFHIWDMQGQLATEYIQKKQEDR